MNQVRIEPVLVGPEGRASAQTGRRGETVKPQTGEAAPLIAAITPETEPAVPLLPPPDDRADMRSMSPRQLAEFAYELYVEGTLNWDEFRLVGSPPELHPDYNSTIGGLLGEPAQPDKPRDQIAYWKERLEFEMRHNDENAPVVRTTARVLEVLRWQEVPRISLSI